MPTNELLPDFRRDYAKLTEAQKKTFRLAVKKFVIDLRRGSFRGSLGVKPMQDNPNFFEMTWEGQDGRATFDYGPEQLRVKSMFGGVGLADTKSLIAPNCCKPAGRARQLGTFAREVQQKATYS
jgi:hypothetical protein